MDRRLAFPEVTSRTGPQRRASTDRPGCPPRARQSHTVQDHGSRACLRSVADAMALRAHQQEDGGDSAEFSGVARPKTNGPTSRACRFMSSR